ncbi:MAG TPA: Na+/H+ antiporter NhaC family protein, partial [Elusimicrobiales bacterium]|nr:Na+/H+ antiporter NhaC family protein [Elusimicrobiales bacterium]
LFSGIGYRLVVWAVMLATGIIYVMLYADRIRKNPRLSSTYESDCAVRAACQAGNGGNSLLAMTGSHAFVLAVLAIGVVALPVGVIKFNWGMRELSGLFLSIGLVSAFAGGSGINKAVDAFVEGARELMNAVLLIGLARGVKVVLDNGHVMDTMLYYMANAISHFPKLIAVQIMFFVQCFINLFIQSGSAQAAISMPIMAPLANMLGITSQTAVLAYQLGDGFANFAIPWNGLTLAVLNLGLVPIWAWFRWAFKLQMLLIGVCMLLLIWPTLATWGPF